jgi:hypothetical protein
MQRAEGRNPRQEQADNLIDHRKGFLGPHLPARSGRLHRAILN